MSMSMQQERRSETVTVYKQCRKHKECKQFVSNADKTALDSVFCTCSCYKKNHKKVKLPRQGPTKVSSFAAPTSNTVLPPPPPPAPTPAPAPQRRPLIVYVRRNGVSSVPRSKEVQEEKEKEEEEEEEVVDAREVVLALPAGGAAKRGYASTGVNERQVKEVVVGLPAAGAAKRGWESSSGIKERRVRTNFSELQKEKLRKYAERVGWRVLKRDQDKMIRLCNEIGITPLMCKNWINKHKERHGHPSTSTST